MPKGEATPPHPITIILFGPSGVCKHEAAHALADVCKFRMERVRVQCLDIKDYLSSSTGLLLQRTQKSQRHAVSKAIDGMALDLKAADLNVVSLHATHLCGSIPVFPCSAHAVRRLEPAVCITLIDDAYACRRRLDQGGYPFGLRQLLNWRQIECGVADGIAEACGVDNFYLAAKHPRVMLYRLLFEPKTPRLYSASQITKARDDPARREEVDRHRRRIHRQYVVFDPLTIDDRVLVNGLPEGPESAQEFSVRWADRWNADISDLGDEYHALVPEAMGAFPFGVDTAEARALNTPDQMRSFQNIIDAQITHRDYRYIDQADVMAAYRPRLAGDESRGVAAEKTYAAGTGATPVVEYSPAEDTNGTKSRPFSTPVSGPVLQDPDTFYERLDVTACHEAKRRCEQHRERYEVFEQFARRLQA